MKIGRNDPCPCGSGKKYKFCCLQLAEAQPSSPSPSSEFSSLLMHELTQRGINNIEDANRLAAEIMSSYNNRSINEFLGLSPSQMQKLLYYPFESASVATWNFNKLHDIKTARFIRLAIELIKALSIGPVKATQTGNLPRKLCQQIYAQEQEAGFLNGDFPRLPNSEPDFFVLHNTRILLELGDIIHLYQGKWVIKARQKKFAQQICEEQAEALSQLYECLIKTYAREYNWGYCSPDEEAAQNYAKTFMFSLYLLHIYGTNQASIETYAEAFYRAFGHTFTEDYMDSFASNGPHFIDYRMTVWQDFADNFGLIEPQTFEATQARPLSNYCIRATPLFRQLLSWCVDE